MSWIDKVKKFVIKDETKYEELKAEAESDCSCVSSDQKWLIAILLGIIFLIVSIPIIYRFSNTIFSKINLNTTDRNGIPTPFGLLLHTIIFIIIVRILMH